MFGKFLAPPEKILQEPEPEFFFVKISKSTFKLIFMYFKRVIRLFRQLSSKIVGPPGPFLRAERRHRAAHPSPSRLAKGSFNMFVTFCSIVSILVYLLFWITFTDGLGVVGRTCCSSSSPHTEPYQDFLPGSQSTGPGAGTGPELQTVGDTTHPS